MTTVFLPVHRDYDDSTWFGVFTTRENAEIAIAMAQRTGAFREDSEEWQGYAIAEWEIDRVYNLGHTGQTMPLRKP